MPPPAPPPDDSPAGATIPPDRGPSPAGPDPSRRSPAEDPARRWPGPPPEPERAGVTAPPPGALPRWPRAWWLLGPLSAALVLGLVASAFVRVPYVTFSPGTAHPVKPAIDLPDNQGYQDEGEVLFLTVSSARDVPVARAVYDWLKGDADVYPVRQFFGDRSATEDQRINEQAMDDSKSLAKVVALRKLGYDVSVTGTGVVANGVDPELPAAGVLAEGDVITGIDGMPVATTEDLVGIVRTHQPGDTITLSVEKGGTPAGLEAPVMLSRNDVTGQPIIGILDVTTRGLAFEFPFPVEIDSGEVSGPSAGLGFTLALIDRLTPGSLTGGRKVAVTGAVTSEGRVRRIGGVGQKVLAAEHTGADLMIVPGADYAEAVDRGGDKIPIYPVDDVDEALAVLESVGGDLGPVQERAAPGS